MRAKHQAEVDQLRAEMKDKLAEVKSHELEGTCAKASDILMESIVPPLKAENNKLTQ